jgi:hypothetical protein
MRRRKASPFQQTSPARRQDHQRRPQPYQQERSDDRHLFSAAAIPGAPAFTPTP